MARPVGRPRTFDPEATLRRIYATFREGGFSGTSLDQVAADTGLNRPSLYAAFGDKRAMYLKTLALNRRQGPSIEKNALGPRREMRAIGMESSTFAVRGHRPQFSSIRRPCFQKKKALQALERSSSLH